MIGLGTIINVIAIIIGSTFGLILKHNLKDQYKLVMIQGVGLTTVVIGMFGAIEGLFDSTERLIGLIIILSIVLGGVIGTFLKIEKRLNQFGDRIEKKYSKDNSQFSKGFVTASIIFCVGAMAIMGSINDGMSGDYTLLAIKSILDGITSMILASKFGFGVLFSFIPVLFYQGSITILAYFFDSFLQEVVKNQMTIIGNILIIGIGLELVEIKKFKVADMLPSIFIPIFTYYIMFILNI